jgi:hypothetical protein
MKSHQTYKKNVMKTWLQVGSVFLSPQQNLNINSTTRFLNTIV